MKKQVSIIIMIIFIFFTGCSNNKIKTSTPNEIYSHILIDDSTSLELALNSGFPLNYENRDSVSLLKYAVLKDSQKSIALLLNRGANPDSDDIAFSIRSFETLELFAKHNFNVNQKNSSGDSLINYYIKNKPQKYSLFLIERGADIRVFDSSNWSPIFWASAIGDITVLDLLLNRGISPFVKDLEGNYPIYYANSSEKLSLLLKYKYNLKELNNEGENILGELFLKSVANNELETVKKLLSKGINIRYSSYGRGAMKIAADNENLEMISFLKSKGLK